MKKELWDAASDLKSAVSQNNYKCFFNYPFQAIEEAVVNAVYHKSYERENPVEIQIHKDKIEILSFPGPMSPINQAMLKKQRVVARDYRNRKIGGFLKESKLTKGRGTGLPIIHKSLEENGSPPPVFETEENNAYLLCVLCLYPLTHSVLGQEEELRRAEEKMLEFKRLSDINPYLRLSVSEIEGRDSEVIKNRITPKAKQLLQYCIEPKSREVIFDKIGLYNNTKKFKNHLKPLIDAGWLQLTIPDKPKSRDQQYLSTELGNKLLSLLEEVNTEKIERIPLVSFNIASVGYDVEKKLLEIEFHHGAVYQYFDVPERVYEELMSSAAKGSYFKNELKDKFKSRKK